MAILQAHRRSYASSRAGAAPRIVDRVVKSQRELDLPTLGAVGNAVQPLQRVMEVRRRVVRTHAAAPGVEQLRATPPSSVAGPAHSTPQSP